MTDQQTPETAETITPTEVAQNENPATAHLNLNDQYMDQVYGRVRDGINNILSNVVLQHPDGKSSKLGDMLGSENVFGITGFIANDVALPLIYALGDLHAGVETMMATTFTTVQKDMCLHKVPDVFLLQQSILQLATATNIYFDRSQFNDKYPDSDGWKYNLIELNNYVMEAEKAAGVTYKEGEIPFRNEPIEVVDIKGRLMPNCRFVNFAYVNSATQTNEVTDIPAIWNDDVNEYVFIPYVLKWKLSDRLPMTINDDLDAEKLSKAFLAQTTESHEQVHQVRVAQRQEALEAAEAQRKAAEALSKSDAAAVGIAPAGASKERVAETHEVRVAPNFADIPTTPQPVPDLEKSGQPGFTVDPQE